jgi:hypothetical protein
MGFGLDIGFIDYFNIWRMTTLNYSAIADLHTLQITRAHRLVFSVCCVFTNRYLIMASNSGDSSASALTTLPAGSQLHRLSLLFTDSLITLSDLLLQLSSIQHLGTDLVENAVLCCIPIISMGTYLFVKAFLSNSCMYLLIKNLLPSSRSCFIVYFKVVTQ